MAIVLYDIFWSHFCEKARFCLDFKGLPYTIVRVNPFTRREVTELGAQGEVPVLRDGDRVIVGSAEIAAHLEQAYPGPPYLPRDDGPRAAALDLQTKCDEWLGPDARRLAYDVALRTPALLEGTLLWRRAPARWLNRPFLRLLEPRVRRWFRIFPEEIGESRERLRYFLPQLQSGIGPNGFLVGNGMTIADIAAVSLLDPLEIVPEFVRDDAYARLFEWKRALAGAHARRQRSPWLSGDPPPGYPRLQTAPAR